MTRSISMDASVSFWASSMIRTTVLFAIIVFS